MRGKFVSLKQFPTLMGFSNKQFNTDGEKICFRDQVRWIRVRKVGKYSYKNSFDISEPWKRVVLGENFGMFDLPYRSDNARPIAGKKIV